jgi:predicted metalloprotease
MIQKKTQGHVVPESFTHGSAEQRQRWFARGFDSGQVEDCDTFAARTL